MQPNKLKIVLSYFLTLHVETSSSEYNPYLEIVLSNGRYVLNSEKVNYSFGSLHTIFKNTFRDIKIENFNFSNCLLLGFGGGSIVDLLQVKHQLFFPVTAIEIDLEIIRLGKKYFNTGQYKDLTVVNQDASQYVKNCSSAYDIIIIDLYVDNVVPEEFHCEEFVKGLKNISHDNSIILFNKMLDTKKAKKEYNKLVFEMSKVFGTVSFLSYTVNNIENRVICVNTSRVAEINRRFVEDITLSETLYDPILN